MPSGRITAAPWYGGKSKGALPDFIHKYLEYTRDGVYCEPYGGMASILLNRRPTKAEVLNDVDGNIVRFFEILRSRGDELIAALQCTPFARDEFENCVRAFDDGPPSDPIERARVWYVCVAQSRAGEFKKRWKAGRRDESAFANRVDEHFPAIMERLRRVSIENLDGADCIRKYDGPDTTMYLDPPYPLETRSKSGNYACDTSADLHSRLLDAVTAPDFESQCAISTYRNDLYDERLADWYRVQIPVFAHAAVGKQNGGRNSPYKRTETLYVNRLPERHSLALF